MPSDIIPLFGGFDLNFGGCRCGADKFFILIDNERTITGVMCSGCDIYSLFNVREIEMIEYEEDYCECECECAKFAPSDYNPETDCTCECSCDYGEDE